MGFEDRDYYRDPEWGGRSSETSACHWIVAITVLVFVAQQIPAWSVESVLSLRADELLKGQVWRLVTYAFCHSGPWHILLNLLCVWWFGRTIEERVGRREFIGFYLISAIVAGLANVGLNAALSEQPSSTIGASGAVMAIMAVFAILYPRQQVLLMGLIPVEIRWLVTAYVVYDALPIWAALNGRAVNDGIAHAAHLGGLLFGFAYQIADWRLTGWLPSRGLKSWWRERERRQSMRLYTPDPEPSNEPNLDDQVDEILRKIHEQGEASLSDRERRLLTEASRRYRERTRS